MFDHSINGGRVDGGTLHLINQSSWIANDQTFPVYQVYFGTNAGTPGRISEVICGSATSGVQYSNPNPANVVQAWANFDLSAMPAPTVPHELSPPPLTASAAAGGTPLALAWPGDVGYFALFQSSGLSTSPTWTTLTNLPWFANNQWTLTLPATNAPGYYRLRAP
jgi:hypothetical protein